MNRRHVGSATLILTSFLASACLGPFPGGPVLYMADPEDINAALDGVGSARPGQPASWGSMVLCLTKPGRVTITSVEPVNPHGGLEVQAFAVRPNPFLQPVEGSMLGDARGTLGSQGFRNTHVVTTVCGRRGSGQGVELGVQATRPGKEDASSDAWRISWKSATSSGSFDFPLAVELCGDKNASAPACSKLDPPLS